MFHSLLHSSRAESMYKALVAKKLLKLLIYQRFNFRQKTACVFERNTVYVKEINTLL